MSPQEAAKLFKVEKPMGAMDGSTQGIKEGMTAYGQGIASLFKGAVNVAYGQEMKGFVAHGAHESASLLFNGSAFVMYPRNANGKEDHGVHGPDLENKGLEQ